jgi:hypothetical protein
MMQAISVLGALAILGAFAANLFGRIRSSNLWYSVANFAGSAVLTVVAVVDRQLGFILRGPAWESRAAGGALAGTTVCTLRVQSDRATSRRGILPEDQAQQLSTEVRGGAYVAGPYLDVVEVL